MKKTSQRFSGVMEIVITLLVIAILTVSGVFVWNQISKKPVVEDPEPNETVQTFEFSVNEFTLFEIEEFGFDFILADIHVVSNKPINLSLSHFVTNEQIQLNSVDQYLSGIETSGYTFGDYPIVFSLNSNEKEMDALLFIPIDNPDLTSLELSINLSPKTSLEFDLTKPTFVGTKSDLGISEQGLEPNMVANMSVMNKTLVSPTEFYQLDANGNRVEANFTSQSQIVAVKVKIETKISEAFRITNVLIKNGGSLFDPVDKSYLIDGATNLINAYISDTTEGYFFFEILGDVNLESFTELHIYLSTTKDKFYTLSLTGNQ